jgi:hypothetical protein
MVRTQMQWSVLIVGSAVLIAGVVGVARDWSTPGVTSTFITGGACLFLALLADKFRTVHIKHGATEIDASLATETVNELNETGLFGVAATYSFVHNQLAEDRESRAVKIRLQDQLVDLMKVNAFAEPVDPARIDEVLRNGSPAERVLVFGRLRGDTTLATLPRLKAGLEASKSGNEQYQALLAADARWPALSPGERAELQRVIEGAPYLRDDRQRRVVAERLVGGPLPPI